jgi:hypothetical protein
VTTISEHIDALQFKLTNAANEQRASYQTKRWHVTRVLNALVNGGHKKVLGKHLASEVMSYVDQGRTDEVRDLTEFYSQKSVLVNVCKANFSEQPIVFTDSEMPIVQLFDECVLSCKDALDAKVSSLDSAMKQNGWIGSIGHVSGAKPPKKVDKCFECSLTDEVGAEAWLVACGHRVRRNDASSLPMPGVAGMFHALDATFLVYLTPLSALAAKGIAYCDLESYFESLGGPEFLKKSTISVVVSKGSWLFIPPGFVWGTVHLELETLVQDLPDEEQESSTKAKSVLMGETVGHAIVFPLFVSEWHKAMDNAVRTAIVSLNSAIFDAKIAKSMWSNRAGTFKKAFELE